MALDDVRAEVCGVWLRVSNSVRAVAIKQEEGSKLREACILVLDKVGECAAKMAGEGEPFDDLIHQIAMNFTEAKGG